MIPEKVFGKEAEGRIKRPLKVVLVIKITNAETIFFRKDMIDLRQILGVVEVLVFNGYVLRAAVRQRDQRIRHRNGNWVEHADRDYLSANGLPVVGLVITPESAEKLPDRSVAEGVVIETGLGAERRSVSCAAKKRTFYPS